MASAAILIGVLAMSCTPPPPAAKPTADAAEVESLYAAYERDGRFFAPWKSFAVRPLDLLRWKLGTNPYDKSRVPNVPVVANDGRELSGHQNSAKITWVGHATFAIHDGDDVVLTDPHFGHRALLPARRFPPGLPIEAIPDDAIGVVSHNHYDHLDAYTVDTLPPSVQWFVPLGLGDWFRRRGRPNVIELGWWQSAQYGRWTMTCLPAQHWSRRIGQATNTTLWCSWLMDSGDHRFFFAGDSGYFHGYAEFGRKFAPIDVALLPIGAYEPRWFMRYQHMDPAGAYQAFLDLGARYMLPMHWGTFDLTDEPLDEPPRELERVVTTRGDGMDRIRLLGIGEGWHVPKSEPEHGELAPGVTFVP